jgi:osmotically-inducible protein OsmY
MTRTIRTSLGSTLAVVLVVALAIPAAALAATPEPQTNDLSTAFRAANLGIDELRVVEVGGIVVIRGRAVGKANAEAATLMARTLGYERVANLVQIIEPPDDEAIERRAERALASQRALDGCNFQLDSDNGALRVAGTVKYELQKDMAVHVLRGVDGVRTVQADLHR